MTKALKPFWRYYGGKYRAAPRYPVPLHRTIVEPFAGAAGYSLRSLIEMKSMLWPCCWQSNEPLMKWPLDTFSAVFIPTLPICCASPRAATDEKILLAQIASFQVATASSTLLYKNSPPAGFGGGI